MFYTQFSSICLVILLNIHVKNNIVVIFVLPSEIETIRLIDKLESVNDCINSQEYSFKKQSFNYERCCIFENRVNLFSFLFN